MKDDGNTYIDLALNAGHITEKQAMLLRDELFMFPGQNAKQIMVKRGWVSPEQIQQLESAPGPNDSIDDEFMMPPPRQAAVPPPPPRPSTAPGVPPAQRPATGTGTGQPGTSFSGGHNPPTVSPDLPRPAAPGAGLPKTGPGATTPQLVTRPPDLSQLRSPGPGASLVDYLRVARKAGCSDLHFSVGRPPFVRFQGQIEFLDEEALSPERCAELNRNALSDEQRAMLDEHQQLDFALELPGLGRHRCNIFRQRLGWEGVFRIIPERVPTLTELGMPPVLQRLTEFQQGLVLVTGPGGCGKTTTVAAMLDYVNRHRTDHIITVEDPVEYVFQPEQCQITQREVGRHTQSFANALRAALRQDPDVIMVGELRDLETTSIAISAAETGHLVFGTLHTNSALRTVARIMDVYPPAQRAQICTMVAESLRGIISQQLIPCKDGAGRVLAMEILVFTSAVSQVIKEGKTPQLVSLMQGGKRLGMRTMDDALMELFQHGLISGREAYSRAENKPTFESIKAQD